MAFERGPHLNIATFCEQVIEEKSGVLSLIRIVDRINITASGPTVPDNMPPYTLKWYLVLAMKSGEARGTSTVKIEPELPSGIRQPPLSLSIHFEGGNRGPNLITQINMVLKEPGLYWFRIYLDDKFLTQIPVEVIFSKMIAPKSQV
ncbi:MAG: hypothetical protein MUO89_06880 [Dehalococcoidia bacterium]|nr:hypothetical protein [Dehalococcoidia bacterium]